MFAQVASQLRRRLNLLRGLSIASLTLALGGCAFDEPAGPSYSRYPEAPPDRYAVSHPPQYDDYSSRSYSDRYDSRYDRGTYDDRAYDRSRAYDDDSDRYAYSDDSAAAAAAADDYYEPPPPEVITTYETD